MAAAKHERSRAVHAVEEVESLAVSDRRDSRQAEEKREERHPRACGDLSADGNAQVGHAGSGDIREQPPTDDAGDHDNRDLRESGLPGEGEHGTRDGDGRPLAVGGEVAGHPPDGEGDNGDGRQLEPADRGAIADVADLFDAKRERDQHEYRGERESDPAAKTPPSNPARMMPTAMPTWLLAGPGSAWESATTSA